MNETHFRHFYSSISGIYRDIQQIRSYFAPKLNIKSVHVFWIFLLDNHPEGMIASQLATESETTRSLVSREIKELVNQGFVMYEENPCKNAYARKLLLTERGKEAAKYIDAVAMKVQSEISKDIPKEDLAVFYKVLDQLMSGFDEYIEHIGEKK